MADSEDKAASSSTPEWQRSQTEATPAATEDTTVDIARRFLDDDAIKTAPRDKKVAFLKAKGIQDDDIQKLLGKPEEESKSVEVSILLDLRNRHPALTHPRPRQHHHSLHGVKRPPP